MNGDATDGAHLHTGSRVGPDGVRRSRAPRLHAPLPAGARAGLPPRVLFISRSTDKEVLQRGLLEPGGAFLQTPFRLDDLRSKVREVIDARHHLPPTFASDDDADA